MGFRKDSPEVDEDLSEEARVSHSAMSGQPMLPLLRPLEMAERIIGGWEMEWEPID
jgi:hypothetical protein